ncbi:MAG: hypothetical protein CM1200mP39_22540 [Dehalococcoidia bacterium]|nr:MAG: hypothetical protein CM1200mP39_22540 [Dehalococcoidia bacterium]
MFQMGIDGGKPFREGGVPRVVLKGKGLLSGPGEGLGFLFCLEEVRNLSWPGFILLTAGTPRRVGFTFGKEWADTRRTY